METLQKPTRVYLWRHPEVVGGRDGRVYGHQDVHLSREGRDQIKAVVRYLEGEKLTAIYTSDLQRAQILAEAIGRAHVPRLKTTPTPALRELKLGVWEGMSYQEISRRYPKELEARQRDLPNFRIEGGESLQEMAARVVPAFEELVAKHKGGTICVVAHAGVNRVILTHLLGASLGGIFRLAQDYASLNIIDVYADGLPVIQAVNQRIVPEEED